MDTTNGAGTSTSTFTRRRNLSARSGSTTEYEREAGPRVDVQRRERDRVRAGQHPENINSKLFWFLDKYVRADVAWSWMLPYPHSWPVPPLLTATKPDNQPPLTHLPPRAASLSPAVWCISRRTTRRTSGSGRSHCRRARARMPASTPAPAPSGLQHP